MKVPRYPLLPKRLRPAAAVVASANETSRRCRRSSTAPDLPPRRRGNRNYQPRKGSEKPKPCACCWRKKLRCATPGASKPLECLLPSLRRQSPDDNSPSSQRPILLARTCLRHTPLPEKEHHHPGVPESFTITRKGTAYPKPAANRCSHLLSKPSVLQHRVSATHRHSAARGLPP